MRIIKRIIIRIRIIRQNSSKKKKKKKKNNTKQKKKNNKKNKKKKKTNNKKQHRHFGLFQLCLTTSLLCLRALSHFFWINSWCIRLHSSDPTPVQASLCRQVGQRLKRREVLSADGPRW